MLKKNMLELCLLHLIAEKEIYGYEILRRLHTAFADTQESALYALLRELHKAGHLSVSGEKTQGGPPRKYYRLTDSGALRLKELLADWHKLLAALQDLGIS